MDVCTLSCFVSETPRCATCDVLQELSPVCEACGSRLSFQNYDAERDVLLWKCACGSTLDMPGEQYVPIGTEFGPMFRWNSLHHRLEQREPPQPAVVGAKPPQ